MSWHHRGERRNGEIKEETVTRSSMRQREDRTRVVLTSALTHADKDENSKQASANSPHCFNVQGYSPSRLMEPDFETIFFPYASVETILGPKSVFLTEGGKIEIERETGLETKPHPQTKENTEGPSPPQSSE